MDIRYGSSDSGSNHEHITKYKNKNMYGFKCKKCGGLTVIVENECDCISKENEILRDTIKNQRELLIEAEQRGEMKAIVQFINQFPKSMTESDRQLQNKRLVYEFATWLHGENFTNPDVSIHDWVETFFQRNEKVER